MDDEDFGSKSLVETSGHDSLEQLSTGIVHDSSNIDESSNHDESIRPHERMLAVDDDEDQTLENEEEREAEHGQKEDEMEEDSNDRGRRKVILASERARITQLQAEAGLDLPEDLMLKGFRRKAKLPDCSEQPSQEGYYERDVFVWWPAKQMSAVSNGVIRCSCGKGKSRFDRGWWSNSVREVVDIDRTFLVTYRQYRCDTCRKIFNNNDDQVLSKNPEEFRLHYTIINFRRLSLTKQLCRLIFEVSRSAHILPTMDTLTRLHVHEYEVRKKMFLLHWNRTRRDQEVRERDDLKRFGAQLDENQKFVLVTWQTRLQKSVLPRIGEGKVRRLNVANIRTVGDLAKVDVNELESETILEITGSKEKSKEGRVRQQLAGWVTSAQEYCKKQAGVSSFEEFLALLKDVEELQAKQAAQVPPPPPATISSSQQPPGVAPLLNDAILATEGNDSDGEDLTIAQAPPEFGSFDDTHGYNGFRFHRKFVEQSIKFFAENLQEASDGDTDIRKKRKAPTSQKQQQFSVKNRKQTIQL